MLAAAVLALALPSAAFDHTHAAFAKVLREYSIGGLVDYPRLLHDKALDPYLRQLKDVTGKDYEAFLPSQRLAFWINVYNAFTLKIALDFYPIDPTRKTELEGADPGLDDVEGVWDEKRIQTGGYNVTLDEIERELLIETFREPRVHFALFKGRPACPSLRETPYEARSVLETLEDDVRRFAISRRCFRIDEGDRAIFLSSTLKDKSKDLQGFATRNWEAYPEKYQGLLAAIGAHLSERDGWSVRAFPFVLRWQPVERGLNETGLKAREALLKRLRPARKGR